MTKKNEEHFRTIRFRLGITYGIFLLFLLLFLSGVVLFFVTRGEERNISEYGASLLKQTSDSIDSDLKKYEMVLQIINNNKLLQEFAGQDHTGDNGKMAVTIRSGSDDLYSIMTSITNTIGNINSLAIFLKEGAKGYFLGNSLHPEIEEDYFNYVDEQIRKLDETNQFTIWAGPVVFQNTPRIVLLRYLIDYQNLEKVGVLALNLELNYLEQALRQTEVGSGGAIFLTDDRGKLIAASDKGMYDGWSQSKEVEKEQSRVRINGVTYRTFSCQSDYTGWKVNGLISEETLNGQRLITRTTLAVISMAGILLSIALSFVLARHLSHPIERLQASMEEVSRTRNLAVFYEDHTFYETDKLGKTFVKMMNDVDNLVVRVRESELKEKEAQLATLQAQLNPHFLYNTLNTINYMLILEDKPEISRMVVSLGDLLRSSIEDSRTFITLKEELELVEKYLYIQQTRFGDQLNYVIQVPKELQKIKVMRFLLQPLVENSIVHGLEENAGTIIIRGEWGNSKKSICLIVEDNGKGMSKEKAAALLKGKVESESGKRHIGVSNVNYRIRLFYGEQYGLTIQSQEGKGTRVTIEIPAEVQMDEIENSCSR